MAAPTESLVRERLAEVEARIAAACARAGRPRADVTLVAVTKTVGVETAALLPELGLIDLAENRSQELWHKAAHIPEARWHFIGHLQRNKVERTLPLVRLVHSVDSERLLDALDAAGRPVPVLLEVNASGEASKHGFDPEQVPSLVPRLLALKNVEVHGLMTMAAPQEAEACRPTFALLRQLRAALRTALAGRHPVEQLSMGMSNDFEVAIEEGATLVRLGSVLFEGLE